MSRSTSCSTGLVDVQRPRRRDDGGGSAVRRPDESALMSAAIEFMASASTSTSSPAQRFLIILEREAAESSRRGCGLAEKCRTQSSDLAGGYVGCGGRALGGDRARSVRRRDGPLCSVAAGAMARQCQASVRLGEELGGRIRARCGGRGCGGSCTTIRGERLRVCPAPDRPHKAALAPWAIHGPLYSITPDRRQGWSNLHIFMQTCGVQRGTVRLARTRRACPSPYPGTRSRPAALPPNAVAGRT
jgi:hypothetical protein